MKWPEKFAITPWMRSVILVWDMLAAALYFGDVMRVRPEQPQWPQRDRFVLSKGHAGPALYATLALKGYFPMEQLHTLNKPETSLPSHCDMNRTAGVDMTAGSRPGVLLRSWHGKGCENQAI